MAAAGLALSVASSVQAASFDFAKNFGGYHNSLTFSSGGIDVTVNAVNGSKVSWVSQGVGRGSSGFDYLMGNGEALDFSFSRAVDVGSILLNSYGSASLSWNYANGSTGSLGYADAKEGGFATALNLTGITGLRVTATQNFVIVKGFDGVVATSEVPVPAAAWLFGSALLGLGGIARKKKRAA
jgi:hypothetical protein